ncbi:MAG: recombinase [Deltaproteobacteria bacterium]|nr:recombinase [Deltaproteobacteria bacterium]
MTDDYERYEKECKKIRKENDKLLDEFKKYLLKKGLKSKTADNHASNIDFYINEFLLYEAAVKAKDGIYDIGMFLGYWFIKKAMWSSPAQIKSNAASLKKFYTFMNKKGMIKKEELDDLKVTIKEEMPEWIATMKRYDDQSITDMDEVWGLDD